MVTITKFVADAVRVAFEFFSQRAALGFAIPEWLPTPDNLQYHSAVARLDTAVYSIITDRQQQLAGMQTPPKSSQVSLPSESHSSHNVPLTVPPVYAQCTPTAPPLYLPAVPHCNCCVHIMYKTAARVWLAGTAAVAGFA